MYIPPCVRQACVRYVLCILSVGIRVHCIPGEGVHSIGVVYSYMDVCVHTFPV